MFIGRTFDGVEPGELIKDALTITETHMILACGLFKDFNALHANAPLAEALPLKSRIVHGPLTAAVMVGVLGNFFSGTTIAFLEETIRFTAPVRPGDTLITEWEVREKKPSQKYGGGVIVLAGICRNQKGETVAEGEGKMLISNEVPAL
jgi:3-hydroxybutyryl-CoA dehydratase